MVQKAIIVAGTFAAYGLLFMVNDWIFGNLWFSAATHWVYLPSGLRLVFVLLFGFLGAIGVAIASATVAFLYYFQADPVSAVGAGIISGLAPYLSRHLCHRHLGLDLDLKNLTASRLITVSLLFSVVSACLHQVLFTWQGYTESFVTTAAVMAFGDFTGCILMLYGAKFMLSKFRWA
jgi:hypothetical protein